MQTVHKLYGVMQKQKPADDEDDDEEELEVTYNTGAAPPTLGGPNAQHVIMPQCSVMMSDVLPHPTLSPAEAGSSRSTPDDSGDESGNRKKKSTHNFEIFASMKSEMINFGNSNSDRVIY